MSNRTLGVNDAAQPGHDEHAKRGSTG